MNSSRDIFTKYPPVLLQVTCNNQPAVKPSQAGWSIILHLHQSETTFNIAMDGLADQSSRLACASCRSQKRKCTRELPSCHLCRRNGRPCVYPGNQPMGAGHQLHVVSYLAQPSQYCIFLQIDLADLDIFIKAESLTKYFPVSFLLGLIHLQATGIQNLQSTSICSDSGVFRNYRKRPKSAWPYPQLILYHDSSGISYR